MSDSNSLTKREQEPESLPALFARMADELTQLFDTKLALLQVELKEEVASYARGAVTMIIGGVVVAVGFALLNVAIAFLVSAVFETSTFSQPVRYALGFVITSLVYLIGGEYPGCGKLPRAPHQFSQDHGIMSVSFDQPCHWIDLRPLQYE
jgi:uncharacterized membrane protein YqjE